MMCVYLRLDQSISVQAYLYAGAGRDLFRKMFSEGQQSIWPTRKPALSSLLMEGWSYRRVNRAWEVSGRRQKKEGHWGLSRDSQRGKR